MADKTEEFHQSYSLHTATIDRVRVVSGHKSRKICHFNLLTATCEFWPHHFELGCAASSEQRAEQHRGKLIICEINEARGSSGGIHLYLHITVTRAQTTEVLLWRLLRKVLC